MSEVSKPTSEPHNYDGGRDDAAQGTTGSDAGLEGRGAPDLRASAASDGSVDRPADTPIATAVPLAQSLGGSSLHSVLDEVDAYMGDLTERPYDHVEGMVWDLAAELRSLLEQLEAAQRHIAGLSSELGITPEDVTEFLGESNPAKRPSDG